MYTYSLYIPTLCVKVTGLALRTARLNTFTDALHCITQNTPFPIVEYMNKTASFIHLPN